MALTLRRRPLRQDLRRVIRKELDAAIACLAGSDAGEAAIHDARTSIKKISAIVRLLKKPLGRRHYAEENDRLSAARRRLGELRDADVTPATLGRLRSSALTPSRRQQLTAGAERHRRDVRRQAAALTKHVLGLLRHTRSSLVHRVAHVASPRACRRGLLKTYDQSRMLLKDLKDASGAAEFHAWRRIVKDHWYQVRLFTKVQRAASARASRLRRLERDLGHEHDLAHLSELLLARPASFGGAVPATIAQGCIHERQQKLRHRAVAEGRRLFARRPREFAAVVDKWCPG